MINLEQKISRVEMLKIVKKSKSFKNVSRRLYPICTAKENHLDLLREWQRIRRIECMQYDFDFINECHLDSSNLSSSMVNCSFY